MTRTVALQNLLDAFQVFDKDNNGRISCAEFRHLMSNCGARDLSEDEADAIFMVILLLLYLHRIFCMYDHDVLDTERDL